jgi:hypothetical protein
VVGVSGLERDAFLEGGGEAMKVLGVPGYVSGLAALLVGPLLVGLTVPPTAGAAGADLPRCRNVDLVASYHATDAATSHRYGRIVLRNVSDHPCWTGGYGGLSYVGHGDGTQVGAAADRTPGNVVVVVLDPGERARSAVDETVAEVYPRRRCRPTHVDGFRVYVPNATRSQFIEHPTIGCANREVHLIAHKPYHHG